MSSSSSEALTLEAILPAVRQAALATLAGGRAAQPGTVDELLRIATRLAATVLSVSGSPQIADLETRLTPTEAALVCTHLLEEVNLDLFELAMWRNWGRG